MLVWNVSSLRLSIEDRLGESNMSGLCEWQTGPKLNVEVKVLLIPFRCSLTIMERGREADR